MNECKAADGKEIKVGDLLLFFATPSRDVHDKLMDAVVDLERVKKMIWDPEEERWDLITNTFYGEDSTESCANLYFDEFWFHIDDYRDILCKVWALVNRYFKEEAGGDDFDEKVGLMLEEVARFFHTLVEEDVDVRTALL